MAEREIKADSSYQDKLFALIPGEITAAYLAIHSIVGPDTAKYDWLLVVTVFILLILNVPYLRILQKVSSWWQIAFTSGAFLFWVASIEIARLYDKGIDPTIVSVLLILYTLLVPFFCSPDIFLKLKGK